MNSGNPNKLLKLRSIFFNDVSSDISCGKVTIKLLWSSRVARETNEHIDIGNILKPQTDKLRYFNLFNETTVSSTSLHSLRQNWSMLASPEKWFSKSKLISEGRLSQSIEPPLSSSSSTWELVFTNNSCLPTFQK